MLGDLLVWWQALPATTNDQIIVVGGIVLFATWAGIGHYWDTRHK